MKLGLQVRHALEGADVEADTAAEQKEGERQRCDEEEEPHEGRLHFNAVDQTGVCVCVCARLTCPTALAVRSAGRRSARQTLAAPFSAPRPPADTRSCMTSRQQ